MLVTVLVVVVVEVDPGIVVVLCLIPMHEQAEYAAAKSLLQASMANPGRGEVATACLLFNVTEELVMLEVMTLVEVDVMTQLVTVVVGFWVSVTYPVLVTTILVPPTVVLIVFVMVLVTVVVFEAKFVVCETSTDVKVGITVWSTVEGVDTVVTLVVVVPLLTVIVLSSSLILHIRNRYRL